MTSNINNKVVHISTVHHPMDPRIMLKECQSLAASGYDVTLIAKKTENLPTKLNGVNITFIKKYNNRFIGMILSPLEAYVKAKKMKAAYYHFHDPEFLPMARMLKKSTNTVIYDIHEDYETGIVSRSYLTKSIRVFLSKVYKQVEKFTIGPLVIVLAEKYYKEKYPKGTCILNYPTIGDKDIKKREGKDFYRNHRLLYTGNVTEDRGAFAHALLPVIDHDISIHLIGKCSRPLYNAMKDLAGDSAERLEVTGVGKFVTKDVIDKAYEEKWLAGVAIFPDSDHYRRKELTKFFEYMLAGLPIICSNFPKWKDFIEKYDCGLTVDPTNTKDIQSAITYLKNNPDEAKRLGENGRHAIENELNWEVEATKLESLYKTQQP
ncbi:glycosyltransferase [Salipaludibacillus agaradhaerens]|uniref:glycosyltransferase n=1 Tax=Salipaludibacillus agaradhaerens TaxID=76935 RepID=UPI001FE838D3|nr:glycosyltransferase [Salipaludibacillus agaradhaerens]